MLTPFFFVNQTSPRCSSTQFEGTARSICADILDKYEDQVTEDDLDRVSIVQMEDQRDFDIVEVVTFDDAVIGSLDRAITGNDLPFLSRL